VISVAARRSGIVREVYVQEGDRVRRGQVLARQEDGDARLTVQRAAAEVEQARSLLRMTQVQRTAATREYERLQKLVDRNFVAGTRVDTARDKIMEAEATLGSQAAAIATAEARLNEAQYNLEQTIIRAPASGRVVRRYANPGSGASTLNVSNMFDLEPDAPRIVRAEIAEAALPNVTVGQEVEIVPEADDTKAYVGKVIRRSAMFGSRKLQSDDPSERSDERVVEVVGQRRRRAPAHRPARAGQVHEARPRGRRPRPRLLPSRPTRPGGMTSAGRLRAVYSPLAGQESKA
jgi:HlyD family secretion protein